MWNLNPVPTQVPVFTVSVNWCWIKASRLRWGFYVWLPVRRWCRLSIIAFQKESDGTHTKAWSLKEWPGFVCKLERSDTTRHKQGFGKVGGSFQFLLSSWVTLVFVLAEWDILWFKTNAEAGREIWEVQLDFVIVFTQKQEPANGNEVNIELAVGKRERRIPCV